MKALMVATMLAVTPAQAGDPTAYVIAYIEWAFDSCGDALPLEWMVAAGTLRAGVSTGEVMAARAGVAEVVRRDGVRATCGAILSVLAEMRAKGGQ